MFIFSDSDVECVDILGLHASPLCPILGGTYFLLWPVGKSCMCFYLIGHNKSFFVCFGREEEKGLQRAQSSVEAIIKRSDSDDSLVEYGEGGEIPFNEDGSFIGQYNGTRRDVRELDFGGSLELHSPMNTIYSLA